MPQNRDMGAIPGSREPSPISVGLGPAGFDPERSEWRSWAGLRLPVGGDDWLEDVREKWADTVLLSQFPDRHVITGDEHDLVIRQGNARKFFEQHFHEVIKGLLIALDRDSDAARSAETEGLGSLSGPASAGPKDIAQNTSREGS